MRIVFLNPSGGLGGAETSLLSLLAALRKAEPEWELHLLLAGDGALGSKASALGVRVTEAPFPGALLRAGDAGVSTRRWVRSRRLLAAALAATAYWFRLRRDVRRIRPTVIHSNGMKMHLLSALIGSSVPLLWHMHDYPGERPLMRRLLRLCSRRCSAIVANSRSVAEDIRALNLAPPVTTIYNAVDFARFHPEGAVYDLDRLAGLSPASPGTVRIGLLATFAHWKGQLVFLEAIGKLPRQLPVRAFIIGDSIYDTEGSQFQRAELEEAARELCSGKVGFTGFVDDSAQALRNLDIVVHASTRREPFGMAILEGMACGKAVIASDAGGATEIYDDGVTAMGHAMGDSGALACQMLRLIEQPGLRVALGNRAMASVRERFDGRRLAGAISTLYRELVSDSGVPDAVQAGAQAG